MDLKGMLWSEIQEIRIAIEKHKNERWENYAKMFRSGLSFDEIKELRKGYDADRNRFRVEGRCNKILEIIQKQDLAIQNELSQ